jgi:two-component system response regulator PilR (NtrC family)
MPDTRVLVADDERSMRELLSIMLKQEGHQVSLAEGGAQAIEALKRDAFDLVITDLRMREVDGLAVLRAAKVHSPQTVVLVITAFASTETAVEAMKLGAYDYITKPFKMDEIKLTIANALERKRLQDENQALKRQLRQERGLENFIGHSRQMLEVFETIRKTADGVSTVLVTGESGTGKELVARAIHEESPRRTGPFVSVNCGAIPETLMESELFGHVKGAFTGAVASTPGLFSAASGGTLFLDEVTEVPPPVQVKLLRAIQEREIRRVGDTKDVKVDVRLIAASNRDVAKAVQEGVLREDLFYRLNVIPIHLAPLRERREDIPLLVAHFLKKLSAELGRTVRGVTPEALAILESHRWPGNIRELENVIERALVLGSGDMLDVDALPPNLKGPRDAVDIPVEIPEHGLDLQATLDQIEQRYIQLALARSGGVQTRAAELLRVSFRQLRYKLQKHATRAGSGGDAGGAHGPSTAGL